MRIGVISDTHVPFAAEDLPKTVYKDFEDVKLILHAGDLVEMGFLTRLNKFRKTVAVCGNMDSYAVKKALPPKEIVKAKGFAIGLIHGEGAPGELCEFAKNAFAGTRLDAIIFGHSHVPFNEVRNGVLYFNPGSPTDKIFAPFNSYGILELTDKIEAKVIRL